MAVKVLKLQSACTSNGDLCFSFGRLDAVPRNKKNNSVWERSGSILEIWPETNSSGCEFEHHRRHCFVSLSKTHQSLLSTGSTQDDTSGHNWKKCSFGHKESNQSIKVRVVHSWIQLADKLMSYYIHQPRIIAPEIMLSCDWAVEEKEYCGIQSGLHCLLRYLNRNRNYDRQPLKIMWLYTCSICMT